MNLYKTISEALEKYMPGTHISYTSFEKKGVWNIKISLNLPNIELSLFVVRLEVFEDCVDIYIQGNIVYKLPDLAWTDGKEIYYGRIMVSETDKEAGRRVLGVIVKIYSLVVDALYLASNFWNRISRCGVNIADAIIRVNPENWRTDIIFRCVKFDIVVRKKHDGVFIELPEKIGGIDWLEDFLFLIEGVSGR